MADLGSDFYCVSDLDPSMRVVSGREGLAQALARRLGSPPESLFYDRPYVFDLEELLRGAHTPFAIQQKVQNEMLADERVQEVRTEVTQKQAGDEGISADQIGSFEVLVEATDSDGPFKFTIDVSAAGIDVEIFE